MFPLLPAAQPFPAVLLRIKNILQCLKQLNLGRNCIKSVNATSINSLPLAGVCLVYGFCAVLFNSEPRLCFKFGLKMFSLFPQAIDRLGFSTWNVSGLATRTKTAQIQLEVL